jgi:hypothetical protein
MATGYKTGGRVAGTPNKATADIKSLAQSYGPAVIARLALLAGVVIDKDGNALPGARETAVQVQAGKELLDRGFGKATQFLAGDPNEGPLQIVVKEYKLSDAK